MSLFSLLNDDQLYTDRAADRFTEGLSSRDEALVARMKADRPVGIGKMAGFVNELGRVWDGAEEKYVPVPGFDRRRFKSAHFGVQHFGGVVAYSAVGFSEKNADLLDGELWRLLSGSANSNAFVRELFADDPSRRRSVSAKFQDEMRALVGTLSRSQGHFIRCIKPNHERKPFKVDAQLTAAQLQSCGVLEAAKVSQAGYPKRVPYRDFFLHFMGAHALVRTRNVLTKPEKLRASVKELATRVLGVKEGDDFALGATQIFLRTNVLARCNAEHERRLASIGRPNEPGQSALGLRGIRVSRRFRLLRTEVNRKLKDKVRRAAARRALSAPVAGRGSRVGHGSCVGQAGAMGHAWARQGGDAVWGDRAWVGCGEVRVGGGAPWRGK